MTSKILYLRNFLLKLLLINFGLLILCTPNSEAKTTIGRVEPIELTNYNLSLTARIDTGAHTCSLHVTNQKVSKEGDQDYIEFDTLDEQGNKIHIKTKVHRASTIKSTGGEKTERYVIREKVKLGNITKEVNINLNDRSDLNYNFLVGRNLLRGDFLVDVSLSRTITTTKPTTNQ